MPRSRTRVATALRLRHRRARRSARFATRAAASTTSAWPPAAVAVSTTCDVVADVARRDAADWCDALIDRRQS